MLDGNLSIADAYSTQFVIQIRASSCLRLGTLGGVDGRRCYAHCRTIAEAIPIVGSTQPIRI